MKIFFIRNVENNIPWPLKVLPVMPVTIFPRKIMKKTCFFSPVCHCGTLHSKSGIPCARPSTALWHTFGRCTAEDRSSRLLGVGSSAPGFWTTSMHTNTMWNISLAPTTLAEESSAPQSLIYAGSVTQLPFCDMPSWAGSYALGWRQVTAWPQLLYHDSRASHRVLSCDRCSPFFGFSTASFCKTW